MILQLPSRESALISTLFLSGVISIFSVFFPLLQFDYTIIFDLLVLSFLFCKLEFYKSQVYALLLVSSYVIVCLLISRFSDIVAFRDFAIAFKMFYYLFLMVLLSSKNLINPRFITSLIKLLLILFIVKYTLLFLSGNERPALYKENNFELLFLLLVYYLSVIVNRKVDYKNFILLCSVFVLSGSKSGIFSLAFLIPFIFLFDGNRKSTLRKVIVLLPCCIFVFMFLFIFFEQLTTKSIESIDRVYFLKMFLLSVEDWNIKNLIFGTMPLSPLSNTSCRFLGYYAELFSTNDPTVCFSVVLHSFVLRTIYDHGIFILFSVFLIIRMLLIRKGFNNYHVICLIGLLFLNGLSVSSINSPFAILGILLYLTLDISKFNTGSYV